MIIVCGNEKGGVGKSTTSWSLAWRLQAAGVNTILVDTDTTQSSSLWYRARSEAGVEPQVNVVAQTVNSAPIVIDLSTKYGAVVVDVGARDYDKLRDFAKIADLWIIPTQVGEDDLVSTRNLCVALKEADRHHKNGKVPLVILLTRTPVSHNSIEEVDAREALAESLPDVPVLKRSLRERKVWRDARRAGRSVYEMPKSEREKAVAEFEEVFTEALKFQASTGKGKK